MNKRNAKEKRLRPQKILVVGGYGYKNTGDEAQLSVVIKRLSTCFPNHFVKILTPDQHYTYMTHNHCAVGEAPRIAFFRAGENLGYSFINDNENRSILHKLANIIYRRFFLWKSQWVYINARLIKAGLPTILLSPDAAGLLYDLQTSDMLYFEGGGYLTGATLSRLWDGILMCRLAKLFNVSVAMSGQTIGAWNTTFNKRYAYKGFKYVKLITLRDALYSPQALEEIGISGTHIYPVCDDALFCDKQQNTDVIDSLFKNSSIDEKFIENGYYVVNIHDWGVNSEEDRNKLLKYLHKLIEYTLDISQKNIIFIPMTPSDVDYMERYLNEYPSNQIKIFKYDFDFRNIRAVISSAYACITMKHHPIIFAAGEHVPVISVNRSAYYEHKNKGALNILGIEDFSISLEDIQHFEKYKTLFNRIEDNRDKIVQQIVKTQVEIKATIKKFENDLKKIITE